MRNYQSMNDYTNRYLMTAIALTALGSVCYADDEGYSLADLADLDVSEIAEIRFETLPAGVYEFEVTEADLKEGTNKDGDKRFEAAWSFKVLECKAVVKPGVDRESLAGKSHTERYFIDPSKPQEDIAKAIGRIRAFVSDMGMESAGKLGDIVKNTTGHIFTGKVVEQVDANDKSITYARMRLESKKAK